MPHGNALETGETSGLESHDGQGVINGLQEMFKAIMEWVGKLPEETQTQAIARINDLDTLWRDVVIGEENAPLSPSASYVIEASPAYSPPYSPMDDMDLHGRDSQMEMLWIREDPEVIDVSSDSDNE